MSGKWEGKLKITAFILVFFVLTLSLSAQESGETQVTDSNVADRPAETELFFDEAAADESGSDGSLAQELPGIGFSDFLRMILVLGFVILLIYGFFWVLKRYSGVRTQGMDAIRILSTRSIKGDTALHLVQTGSRIFLVGTSSHAVNLLSEIDDKESIDQIRLEASRSVTVSSGGFLRMLRDKFGSREMDSNEPKHARGANSDEELTEYLRQQRERLKDL